MKVSKMVCGRCGYKTNCHIVLNHCREITKMRRLVKKCNKKCIKALKKGIMRKSVVVFFKKNYCTLKKLQI